MTADTKPVALPELPKAVRMSSDQAFMGYTADQMRAYAEQAIDALRAEVETLHDGLDYLRQMQGVPDVLALRAKADRAERLAEAGRRVTAAFRALGETTAWTRAAEQARYECEAAMLALDAALEQEAGRG